MRVRNLNKRFPSVPLFNMAYRDTYDVRVSVGRRGCDDEVRGSEQKRRFEPRQYQPRFGQPQRMMPRILEPKYG
jgi:hypothetical protein